MPDGPALRTGLALNATIEPAPAKRAGALRWSRPKSNQISRNVTSAARGTQMIVGVLGDIASATTETHDCAQNVLAASRVVGTTATDLRHQVEQFLAKVAV